MSDFLGSLLVRLGVDAGEFESDLGRADKQLQKFGRNVSVIAANAALEIGQKLAQGIRAVSDAALAGIGEIDKLADASKRVGVSVTAFSELKFAVEQSGGSVGALETGLRTLSKQMAEAAGGGKEAQAIFSAIGVSAVDSAGKLRPVDQVFKDISDRFQSYEDGAGEVAIATKLLGRSGTELIETMNGGSAALNAAAKEARELGVVLGEDAARSAQQYGDNIDKIKAGLMGLSITLGNEILPSLLKATQATIDFIKSLREEGTVAKFVDGLKSIVSVLDELFVYFAARSIAVGLATLIASISATASSVGLLTAAVSALKIALAPFVGTAGLVALLAVGLYSLATAEDDATRAAEAHKRAMDEINSIAQTSKTNALELAANKRMEAIASYEAAKAVLAQKVATLELAQAQEKGMAGGPRETRYALGLSTGRAESSVAKTKALIAQLDGNIDELTGSVAALAVEEGLAAVGMKKLAPPIIQTGEAAKEAAKKAEDGYGRAGKATADWLAKIEALRVELGGPAAKAHAEYAEKVELVNQAYFEGNIGLEEATAMYGQLRQEFEKLFDPISRARDAIESFQRIDPVEEEILRLRVALEGIGDPAMRAQIESLIEELERLGLQARGVGDDAQRGASEFRKAWEENLAGINDAFADFIGSGMSNWRGFVSYLQRSGQEASANIARSFQQAFSQGGGGMRQFGQSVNQSSMYGQGGTGGSAAGWGSALGTAYSGWQSFQQGNKLAGIAQFTMAGAQIGGIWGAVIGLCVGILVAVFKKVKPEDIRMGGTRSQVRGVEGDFDTDLGTIYAGSRLIKYEELIQPLQQFDKAIKDLVLSVKGGDEQLVKIKNALRTWVVDLRGEAATAENVLNSRFQAILGTFSVDIQTFVNGAEKLEERVQRLADAFAAQAVFDDLGLDVTFGRFLDIVADLNIYGETTGATMQRLVAATQILGAAADVMGVQVSSLGEAFIRTADEVVGLVGGLDAFNALFQAAFDAIFTSAEQAEMRYANAIESRNREFADVGLDPNATADQIKQVVRAALASGNAEFIRNALEAAAAFGEVNNAADALNTTLGTTVGRLDDLSGAQREYADFLVDIDRQIADLDASDFQMELRGISQAFRDNVARANELARAAGLQGAREQDLARIHALAAGQAAAAIRALESASRDLVAQLYGEGLTTAADGAASAVGRVAAGVQALERAAQSFKEATLLDDQLSPLKVKDRYQEALRQLRATGDEGTAKIALQLARQLMASGGDYNAAFDMITGLVRPRGADVGGGGGDFSGGGQVARTLDANARRGLAVDLAQNIADLAGAQGLTFAEVATNLGFTIDQLAQDLGLSNEALDTYLQTLQADSYSFEDLASLVTAQVDRIIAAIVGEVGVNVNPTGRALGGDPVKGDQPTPVVIDPEFVGKSESQNEAVVARLESLESTLGQLLARIAENTEQTAETNQAMAKDGRRPGPVRTTRSNPVVS